MSTMAARTNGSPWLRAAATMPERTGLVRRRAPRPAAAESTPDRPFEAREGSNDDVHRRRLHGAKIGAPASDASY